MMDDRNRLIAAAGIFIAVMMFWYFAGRRIWFNLFYEDRVEAMFNSKPYEIKKKMDDLMNRMDDIEGRLDEMTEKE
jgi:hypothetical protein